MESLTLARLSLLAQLDKNPQSFAENLYRRTSPFSNDYCYLLNEPDNKNLTPISGSTGTYYTIENGNLIKVYSLNATESLSIVYQPEPIPAMIQLMSYAPICDNYPDLTNLKFIASDRFTNSTLINYYLSYLFTRRDTPKLPTILNIYTSNICSSPIDNNRSGLQLYEQVDGGTLLNISNNKNFDIYRSKKTVDDGIRLILSPTIILSIVQQVLSTLDYLQQNFQFAHGHLTVTDIFLSSQPASFSYSSLNVNSPFTIKLANFDTASISLQLSSGTYRLYNRNWLDDNLIYRSPFIPHIVKNYYFIPRDYPFRYYERTLSLGIPFYPTFDTYTFIISLLLIPEIYHSVFSSNLQKLIWDPLWIPEDRFSAFSRLQQLISTRASNTFETIFDMLREFRLNCSITSHLLSLFPSSS